MNQVSKMSCSDVLQRIHKSELFKMKCIDFYSVRAIKNCKLPQTWLLLIVLLSWYTAWWGPISREILVSYVTSDFCCSFFPCLLCQSKIQNNPVEERVQFEMLKKSKTSHLSLHKCWNFPVTQGKQSRRKWKLLRSTRPSSFHEWMNAGLGRRTTCS